MPPCAFAELHDCSDPFVASATRAPARSAETAAASPEAPLPITSTSKEAPSATTRLYLIRVITPAYRSASLRRSFSAARENSPMAIAPVAKEESRAGVVTHLSVSGRLCRPLSTPAFRRLAAGRLVSCLADWLL